MVVQNISNDVDSNLAGNEKQNEDYTNTQDHPTSHNRVTTNLDADKDNLSESYNESSSFNENHQTQDPAVKSNFPNHYTPEATSDSSHLFSSNNQGTYGNLNSRPATTQPSSGYLDPQWGNMMFDPSAADYLYNIELPTHISQPGHNSGVNDVSSGIMHHIQYQNNVHPEVNNLPAPENFAHQNRPSQLPYKEETLSQSQSPHASISQQPIDPTSNTTSQGPNTKSTKQRRPCDQCRRRKTKCVIVPNTNNCVQCEAKQLTCTYTTPAAKRKASEMGSDSQKRGKTNAAALTGDNSQIPDVPIRETAPVQDYSAMNNSLLKKTLSLQFPRSSFYVGPTNYLYDMNLLNTIIDTRNRDNNSSGAAKIEQASLSNSISLRKVCDKVHFVLKDDQSPQSYQTMSNDVDTIEKLISPHGQILIDLYFRIIHPSYPIVHKKVFLEKYARTHREFTAPLIAAVYVLAIQWWDYDPQLNRFPKPNVELILKIGLKNYLQEILKRPKLSAVQAGLLLLQCKHIISCKATNNQVQNSGDADYSEWVLCSQVVSLAEELGLGLDCNNWKLPKWERGLRKRLAWAVYMEDKWLSLKDSRPSHINENNWIVLQLHEEDFPDKHGDGDLKEGSSDLDTGKKIFTNLIALSKILSDILNHFYSMKAMREITNISEVLKLAKPLQLQLRNWFYSLPSELQMNLVQPRKLCSNGYLHLAYFATELTLHRKITTIIYQQTNAGNPPPPELVNVCRSAAKTRLLASIEFVRDLKPEHIHSFWHSSSSSNFTLIGTFAAILFISSPTQEEADFYRDQIFNYRWILKISSKGFDQVAEALSQLDLVLGNIPGLLNDNVDMPMVLPNVQDQQTMPQTNQSYSPFAIPQTQQPQQSQSPHPSLRPNPSYEGKPTNQQKIRMPSNLRESPYNSPQSFYTPPFVPSPQNKVVNSPHTSQGNTSRAVSPRVYANKAPSYADQSPHSSHVTKSPESTTK
ncbi:Dal81 predicted zinc-finger protein [Candida orthopsilosis Co 90-125]|uniref:Dal81 predicted zinc-finger protein n=1 Tax=Candida orthopsilosis (strain 90-125) TaxID=1136231 RepID=H8WVL4_CANO9|nr:Dal81 predicted zinc-finger protein [Candida orthopsilosis Co 90-125]CCG20487.1 Dal81 predicted zinc-finger protein [Candida orthopsilosis Co 90-125]